MFYGQTIRCTFEFGLVGPWDIFTSTVNGISYEVVNFIWSPIPYTHPFAWLLKANWPLVSVLWSVAHDNFVGRKKW